MTLSTHRIRWPSLLCVVPAMPLGFVVVYVGVLVVCGWVGWKTQREAWFLAAFAWLLFVGPACWMLVGAAQS